MTSQHEDHRFFSLSLSLVLIAPKNVEQNFVLSPFSHEYKYIRIQILRTTFACT